MAALKCFIGLAFIGLGTDERYRRTRIRGVISPHRFGQNCQICLSKLSFMIQDTEMTFQLFSIAILVVSKEEKIRANQKFYALPKPTVSVRL